MSLSFALLYLLGGLVALTIGAEFLVRGAASLALRMGISTLVVGLTIVAYGTSAPEMVVSVRAALAGQPDISIGNVVGSNIANIGLILGLSALVYPIQCHWDVVRREIPIMIGVAVLLGILTVSHWEAADPLAEGVAGILGRGEGILLLALAITYTAVTYWRARHADTPAQQEVEREIEQGIVAVGSTEAAKRRSIGLDLGYILVGLVLLFFGGQFLVEGAVAIARMAGLSELVIGLTIVAVGTSMPELATSVIAAFRKQSDIAVGNVVGSNIFNILAILGVSAIVHPIPVSSAVLERDIPIMLFVSALCLPIMASGRRISRLEGMAFLGIYIAYTVMLIAGS